jgi:hypothetical protein
MKRLLFYLLVLIALPISFRAQVRGPYFDDPIIDIDTVTGITRLGVPFEDTIWITDPLLCPIAL